MPKHSHQQSSGDLQEDLFMEQPEGFKGKEDGDLACKLQKSLYALK